MVEKKKLNISQSNFTTFQYWTKEKQKHFFFFFFFDTVDVVHDKLGQFMTT